ncbi:hypothetical protein [Microbacterium sp. cx-59]|uniref:hypothetical protein n=1 Tax=Microbacterium sp. cx-59 TaxID=2891207 RepID=UPI001E413784|nr:hypothetical protein [Microbacterium sp. cx-59]MCC4907164.1 hypothetical protein [Microbacterium sp. cx-59]
MSAISAVPSSSGTTRMRTEALVPLGWGRWRVLDAHGAATGLIEEHESPRGARYRALRYRWSSRSFVGIGEFWSVDDALEALRSS